MTDVLERIAARSIPNSKGCVIWQGASNPNGYGRKRHAGKTCYTHRLAFEAAKGPIPPGFDIDHLCRDRACSNPEHLEAVTRRENALRGIAPIMLKKRAASVTHCPRGHEYNAENTMIRLRKGYQFRECRECHRTRWGHNCKKANAETR